MTSPTLYTAGRYDLRAIMGEAVRRAGGEVFGSWRRRMCGNLRLVWMEAKRQARAARPQPVAKLVLDHQAAFRLLSRIKAHASNRGRDLLTQADRLPDHAAVLAFARAEFAALPVTDRPAMLVGLGQPAPVALPIRRPRVFHRGSHALSYGW